MVIPSGFGSRLVQVVQEQEPRTWPDFLASALLVVLGGAAGALISPLTGRSWWEGALACGSIVLGTVVLRVLAGRTLALARHVRRRRDPRIRAERSD